MTPEAGTRLVCIAWVVSWLGAAAWSDPAAARPGFRREWKHHLVTMIGIVLLFGVRAPYEWFGRALWPVSNVAGWLLVALCAVGFGFTWWARLHLGRLWSATVQRKADHRVVDTGPYGIVRHPIYTGVIVAMIAVTIQQPSVLTIAGTVVMTVGWWIKARLEERFLREQLGRAAYDGYAARVPMLIPFT
ncbi:MAG TPA: isoprenylcysteine carboxylmethyltransferase family protein [Gemmatimonadaceae bacterium]